MEIKLSFFGAAQNVTGSRFLVETNDTRILVDCGMYQERQFRDRNWEPFPIPPETIDAVLITHSHLDHCGFLPKLVQEGFKGKIYSTAAAAEIARIILLDSAHIQEEDAEYKRKRHKREGRKGPHPVVPLYTTKDAESTLPLFSPVKYKKPTNVGDGLEATFYNAGHVLGASMIELKVKQNGDERIILFSGDVGRWDMPIIKDPTIFEKADYVLVESTYGDRVHDDVDDINDKLAKAINETTDAGGNISIPSFALERSQELLYRLNQLLLEDRIPHLMVFLDSPMAIRVTEVFEKHPELYDEEMAEYIKHRESPFNFPGLKMSRSVDESKAINHIKGTAITIAGSGMCTGGRIKHHLINNISRPESTILFVGYQAIGTLGRHIVDGADKVRIHGQKHRVRARVVRINGFSAHADRDELLRWLSGLKKSPRQVFVVHGEEKSTRQFKKHLKEKTGWEVSIPSYKDTVVLD